MPATHNPATVHCHVSLNVADLARAVDFYRTLLGTEPATHKADYAKFELSDPPLVLSLEPNRPTAGGSLNHLGFRLPELALLIEFLARLEAAGIPTQRQAGVECCHSRQTKFWVSDPDRNLWEVYVLEGDANEEDNGHPQLEGLPVINSAAAKVVWEHRLGEALPAAIPLGDRTAAEARLQGTLNALMGNEERLRLLREARRVLRPCGQLIVHALVADKPLSGCFRQLPGPAAAVQFVPLEADIGQAVEAAGFVGLWRSKLSSDPCFEQDGVAMRELLLQALKPEDRILTGRQLISYKGPFRQVVDDEGQVYRRGEHVAVAARIAKLLKQGPYAEHFVFFTEPGGRCCS
jgi:catechol 2,3-dioxygenase-like lactoylglutathione lyase family enzyme